MTKLIWQIKNFAIQLKATERPLIAGSVPSSIRFSLSLINYRVTSVGERFKMENDLKMTLQVIYL